MYRVSVCRRASGKGWRAVARYKDDTGWHGTTKSLRDAKNNTLRYKVKRAKLKSAYTGAVEQVDAAFWKGLKPIGCTYSDWLNEQLTAKAPVDVDCVCEGIADGGWPMVRFYLPS